MVKIITLSCSDCGTVVAGNVLENHREMKCPGLGCGTVLRFEDLEPDEQEHLQTNRQLYAMED